MARKKYQATFSNDVTLTRSTDTRTYSHAWLAYFQSANIPSQQVDGFARTEELAEKALASATRQVRKHKMLVTFSEVAPAVEC